MSQGHLTGLDLTEYVDGLLAPGRASRVEEHLQRCELCAEALAGCRSAVAAVGRLRPAAVPADLGQRVAAKLEALPLLPLDCRRAAPLTQEYLDRCLSPLLSVRFAQHLKACAHCHAEFTSLARAASLVRSLALVPVPERVREAVLATPRRPATRPVWALSLRPAVVTAGLAAAGALVLLLRPGAQPTVPIREQVLARQPTRAEVKPPASVALREPAGTAERGEPAGVAVAAVTEGALGEVAGEAAAYRPSSRRAGRPSSTAAADRVEPPARPVATMLYAAPTVAVPAAVRTLKAVARSADGYREARRAMDLAAERFATLSSEEMLDRLPDLAASGSTPAPGEGQDVGAAAGGTEGAAGTARDSASAPGVFELRSPLRPLV